MSKDLIAISAKGDSFVDDRTLNGFRQDNPNAFLAVKGNPVSILDTRLMSFGTAGKISGFTRSSKGTLLVLVKWHKDAAPLRVRIEAIMPKPPKKFWMVIPFSPGNQRHQSIIYEGSSRRQGLAPAIHRFDNLAAAQEYIAGERRATRFHNYAILESVQYHQGDVVIPM